MAERSSDIESDQEAGNPHAHIGAKAVDSMLRKKVELRKRTKIDAKQTTNDVGAPGTRYKRRLACNYFDGFRTGVLEKSKKETPSADDLERFLYGVVDDLAGRVDGKPSYTYLKSLLGHVVDQCVFDHADFKLTPHDRRRLSGVFQKLLDRDQITKEPSVELNWVGTFITKRLTQAIFEQAFTQGTVSWDVSLSKMLSINLVSALVSRSGDVLRSQFYKANICMCYKHVVLKVVETNDGLSLSGIFTMAHNKSYKDDPKKSPKVRLDMLLGKAANILCPIKLIVAMAMRTGALEDRTVEDVIGRAHSRPDRCVVWTPSRREDPLLPAFASRGNAISPKTPAPAKQLILSLQQASDLAGLLKQAKPHDLRRGAVRDVVHTPGITAIDVNLAAEVLSHTFEAKKNGISRSYVGHVKEPYFTKRVEEFADGDKAETFAMEFASSSFKRKVNTTAQIDAYCEENNLDPSNKNVRKQAGHRLSKKVRNDWVNAQMNPQASYPIIPAGSSSVDDPSLRDRDESMFVHGNEESNTSDSSITPGDESMFMNGNEESNTSDSSITPEDESMFMNGNEESNTSDSSITPGDESMFMNGNVESNTSGSSITPGDDRIPTKDDDDANIDPIILQMQSLVMGGRMQGSVQDQVKALGDFIDPLREDIVEDRESSRALARILQASPMEWIQFCAKINVYHKETPKNVDNLVRGNSRDEPSIFKFVCKNETNGCKFSTATRSHAVSHEAICTGKPPPRKDFHCHICGASLITKSHLTKHIQRHEWVSKRCQKAPCNGSVAYESMSTWDRHNQMLHGRWTPIQCPEIEACKTVKLWDIPGQLIVHLRSQHDMSSEDIHKKYPTILTRLRKGDELARNKM